ncbi:hypothetical protein Dimus_020856 [Dionaea muscipula]
MHTCLQEVGRMGILPHDEMMLLAAWISLASTWSCPHDNLLAATWYCCPHRLIAFGLVAHMHDMLLLGVPLTSCYSIGLYKACRMMVLCWPRISGFTWAAEVLAKLLLANSCMEWLPALQAYCMPWLITCSVSRKACPYNIYQHVMVIMERE